MIPGVELIKRFAKLQAMSSFMWRICCHVSLLLVPKSHVLKWCARWGMSTHGVGEIHEKSLYAMIFIFWFTGFGPHMYGHLSPALHMSMSFRCPWIIIWDSGLIYGVPMSCVTRFWKLPYEVFWICWTVVKHFLVFLSLLLQFIVLQWKTLFHYLLNGSRTQDHNVSFMALRFWMACHVNLPSTSSCLSSLVLPCYLGTK